MKDNMKIVAMYLPQFHRIPENDQWWGEGFTDWVSVKNAVPLYDGHRQPRIPLDKNYYDLTDSNVLRWQASIMKEYGLDGICMYHYWFRGGRRILEKPAEILLAEKGIDIPFCFCWANESWARTWSGIKNSNSWISDDNREDGTDGVLLQQAYGNESDWQEHFSYLLPFFRDKRYITIDGRPVFLLYNTEDVLCLYKMLTTWEICAREAGIKRPYVIGINPGVNKKIIDAELIHQPSKAIKNHVEYLHAKGCFPAVIEADDLWEEILHQEEHDKTFYGGFVGYDDTPRRKNNGIIVKGVTPEKFEINLASLIAKNRLHSNPIVFVNAWNEWGEGMYLEPDMEHGFGYLRSIKMAKKRSMSIANEDMKSSYVTWLSKKARKYESYFSLLSTWMKLNEISFSISDYLKEQGFCRLCLYGYGIFGRHLLQQIQGSNISIVAVIDRDFNKETVEGICFISPQKNLPEIDALIVTPYFQMGEIRKRYEGQCNNILSIEELILSAYFCAMEKEERNESSYFRNR